MTLYLHHSLAHSTRAAYSSAARSFTHFCLLFNYINQDGTIFPASEHTLMLFSTYLAYSLKPQSIKVYLSGICNAHLERGLPDPLLETPNLRRLLRGIKRSKGSSPDSRLPITASLLRTFRTFLNLQHYDHIVLWAGLLTAFFGFLRSSELLALRHGDATRQQDGYEVHIRVSKTDPFRFGARAKLVHSGDPSLCAVEALDQLKQAAPSNSGNLLAFEDGTTLSRHHLNTLIKALVARCGIPPNRFSSHSFRIGAATAAAAAGIPDWQIQALGRWSSESYRRYIRLANPDARVASALASSRL